MVTNLAMTQYMVTNLAMTQYMVTNLAMTQYMVTNVVPADSLLYTILPHTTDKATTRISMICTLEFDGVCTLKPVLTINPDW